MKSKIIIAGLVSFSFIFSSSGIFHDSGAYVSGAFRSEKNTDAWGDTFTTTQYGGWVGYFVTPDIEVYAGGSIFNEVYDDSEWSDYDTDGTVIDFGGAYHYRNAMDLNGSPLNIRVGGEYSMLTMDGDWLSGIDASATNMALNGGAYLPMELAGLNVIPFVMFSSNNMTVTVSGYGETVEESEQSTTTSVGMGVNLGQFVVSPVIHLYDSGDTAFVLAASMGLNLGGASE